MSITLLHTYFLECCGIKINWTLIAEWNAMHSCKRKLNSLFFLVTISIARTVRQGHEWRHGRIKYEWRFWIPLLVLTVTNSCCISSKSPASRLPTGSEVDALEPHPPVLGPIDHCLVWSTELFPTIINENTLLAQKWLSAKVAPCSQRGTRQSQSVSYSNRLPKSFQPVRGLYAF